VTMFGRRFRPRRADDRMLSGRNSDRPRDDVRASRRDRRPVDDRRQLAAATATVRTAQLSGKPPGRASHPGGQATPTSAACAAIEDQPMTRLHRPMSSQGKARRPFRHSGAGRNPGAGDVDAVRCALLAPATSGQTD